MFDKKLLHNRTQQKATNNENNQAEGDSDLRYHISSSKNCPLDIFSTIRENRDDPAYHVRF